MSFLAGRLAGKEGAFFFEESKQAVTRLAAQKKPPPSSSSSPPPPPPPASALAEAESESIADVLPEVLRHSLPSKLFREAPTSSPSSYAASKWALRSGNPSNRFFVNPDALNPLRAYISLPQVTFGPKRWQLPEAKDSFMPSTANDLRREKHPPVDPEKLKAAAEGLSQIGKAFAIATAVIFGGATLMFGVAASKLDLQNSEDIRARGRDFLEPKFEMVKKQLIPFKDWAESMSKKWQRETNEDVKEKRMIKELTKILGAKSSN